VQNEKIVCLYYLPIDPLSFIVSFFRLIEQNVEHIKIILIAYGLQFSIDENHMLKVSL
jgi:hypothetical protein